MASSDPTAAKPSQPTPPPVGIMTRTLVESCVIKAIIPARIRHQNLNDVIFIMDESIEINEYHSNGGLEQVARISAFGSKILSARCFGKPITSIKLEYPSSGNVDTIIKPDPDAMDIDYGFQGLVPPHILAMALESGALIFFYAFYDSAGTLISRTSSPSRMLYSGGGFAKQAGKHMAIDPTSSLLAVAPHEGHVSLFSLKEPAQIQAEHQTTVPSVISYFDPILRQRTIAVNGIILKMDFLFPTQGHEGVTDSLVVLIIIAFWKGKTRFHRYEWPSGTDLEYFKEVGFGHILSAEEQHPLLLIPITVSSGFLLVCEKRAFLYGNTSQGCWESPWPQNLNDEEINGAINDSEEAESSPQERGSSHGAPIWTQWSRPTRRADWFAKCDAIYVCREDGVVKYLLIESNGRRPTISKCRVGNIKSNVDSALACIDNGTGGTWHEDGKESEDVLVAGGSMGDGALYSFRGRHNAVKGQIIPRWAPISDICTVPSVPPYVPLKPFEKPAGIDLYRYPQQLFACIGRGPRHGAICDMQYGTRASLTTTYVLPDTTFLDLWALHKQSPSSQDGETMILLTDPEQTLMINESGEPISLEEYGLDDDSRTIAAGSSPNGLFIQVTYKGVRVVSSWSKSITAFRDEKNILAAHVDGSIPAVLICLSERRRASLHLITFIVENNSIVSKVIGAPVSLEADVISLYFHLIDSRLVAFAGDLDCRLLTFLGTMRDGLRPSSHRVFEVCRNEPPDPDSGICESIALIASPKQDQCDLTFLVLCGLRSGTFETHVVLIKDEGEQHPRHSEKL